MLRLGYYNYTPHASVTLNSRQLLVTSNMDRTLHIVTCIANPLLWKSRVALAEKAIESWLMKPNVRVTLVECAYGGRDYQLDYLALDERVTYIPVRAKTLLWIKENLMNIGITRLPQDAKYVATIDADVIWRGANWADETINALDIYPVIQPWQYCFDLGPNSQHNGLHNSFAFLYKEGKHVIPGSSIRHGILLTIRTHIRILALRGHGHVIFLNRQAVCSNGAVWARAITIWRCRC